jgi:hypothetical protein
MSQRQLGFFATFAGECSYPNMFNPLVRAETHKPLLLQVTHERHGRLGRKLNVFRDFWEGATRVTE